MGEYWNISAFMFMFRRKIISPTVWPVAFLPLCFLLHRHEGFKPETFLTFSNDLCTSQKPDEINASKSLVKWHIGSNWEACAKKTHLLGEPCFVVVLLFSRRETVNLCWETWYNLSIVVLRGKLYFFRVL